MLLLLVLEPHFDLQGCRALKTIVGLCKYEAFEIIKGKRVDGEEKALRAEPWDTPTLRGW